MAGFDPNQLRNDHGQWARWQGRRKATTITELAQRQKKVLKSIPRKAAWHTIHTAETLHHVYRAGRRLGVPHLDTGVSVVDNVLTKPYRR
jgi:hypothetical protein